MSQLVKDWTIIGSWIEQHRGIHGTPIEYTYSCRGEPQYSESEALREGRSLYNILERSHTAISPSVTVTEREFQLQPDGTRRMVESVDIAGFDWVAGETDPRKKVRGNK